MVDGVMHPHVALPVTLERCDIGDDCAIAADRKRRKMRRLAELAPPTAR
jgi:hypothetical protein